MARIFSILTLFTVVFLAVSPAEGGKTSSSACGAKEFAYAGLQAENTAHGVSATIAPLSLPTVTDGHVGGWIGVGGTDEGPGGTAEWLQVGLASFAPTNTIHLYYEVTVGKKGPHYHELETDVQPGEKHKLAVLEMRKHNSWWRVWVDDKPVSEADPPPGQPRRLVSAGARRELERRHGHLQHATRTASRTSELAQARTAASGRTLKRAYAVRGCRATRSCRRRASRATFVATSLACLSADRERVPTGISARASGSTSSACGYSRGRRGPQDLRLVRAVHADEAATRPVGEDRRAGARAERDGP